MTAGPAPLQRRHLGEAAAALARAFADDPAFTFLWPRPRRRERGLEALLSVPLHDGLAHGWGEVVLDGGAIAGAAVWYPAGAYPLSPARSLRATPRILAAVRADPRAARRLQRLGTAIDRAFPRDRPAYLAVIGIVPEAQGRGLGGELLASGLARCDAAGEDCYLETDTAAAARLYERHGFAVLQEGAQLLPGGPTHWLMRRPAQSGS